MIDLQNKFFTENKNGFLKVFLLESSLLFGKLLSFFTDAKFFLE